MRYNIRTRVLSLTYFLTLWSIACPLGNSDNTDLRPVGPTVKADLLIYFKSDVSQEQINAFSKEVLSTPHQEGRGDYLAPGVRTFLRIRAVEGHEGIAVTFFPAATKEQRQELIKNIKGSPHVYKILENTTPDRVQTLK